MSPLSGPSGSLLNSPDPRLASLAVHSAAYRADLVSGETHKDGMARKLHSTLPRTPSPSVGGFPMPTPLGEVVLCALLLREWPQGIFSGCPLGSWA